MSFMYILIAVAAIFALIVFRRACVYIPNNRVGDRREADERQAAR